MVLRLQKYLSECGVCSRRHAEEAIKRWDVIVNGQPALIGQSIDPEKDTVEFSGQLVNRSAGLVYYAMNKPRGIESTCAQKDGKSIIDIIDPPTRIFPIGRLDKDSSGLILLTNDGRITHRLLHPSFEHEKEYLVTTYGKIDDQSLHQMSQGVRYTIEEGPRDSSKSKVQSAKWRNFYNNSGKVWMGRVNNPKLCPAIGGMNSSLWTWINRKRFVQTQPCEIKRVSSDTFRIILKEGKNRQIRRMVEACGHQVKKLKRIRIEHILLWDMPEGAYRELKRGEREEILRRSALPLVDYPPIVGEVVHGDGKGHTLGFPTANIVLVPGILPPKTFTCRVTLDGEVFLWAGTFNANKVQSSSRHRRDKVQNEGFLNKSKEADIERVNDPQLWTLNLPAGRQCSELLTHGIFEVHILSFDRDIYGKILHIEIMDVIRDNRAFSSLDELKTQIEKDVNHVRAHWKSVLEK